MLFSRLRFTQPTRTRLATMGLFFIFGCMYASWGIHIPTIKGKFDLNAAQLSVAFFAIAAGSIATLVYVGKWIDRVGNRMACTVGGALMCSSAAGILLAPSFITLNLVLVIFGIGTAILDVGVNAQASMLEKTLNKPVMSFMHSMYSTGGIAGATGGGILLSHGMTSTAHFVSIALSGLALVLFFCPALTGKEPAIAPPPHLIQNPRTTRIARIHRGILALGGIALIGLIAEGAVYDWITVYMRENLQAGPALSSTAYAAFSAGIACGRFVGDFLRTCLGNRLLLALSGWVACTAITTGLLFTSPSLALISFAIAGLGFANVYPIMIFAAARVEGIQAAQGIAHVAGIGYVGLLIGPVLIGTIAQLTSLSIGLTIIALCAALVAYTGPRAIRHVLAQQR